MATTLSSGKQPVIFPTTPAPPAESHEATSARPYSVAGPGDALEAGTHQLSLLVELNAALAGALDLGSALGRILSRLADRERLSHVRIYRLDESAGELQRVACGGRNGGSRRVVSLEEPTLLAWAIRQRQAVYVPRADKDPRCQTFGVGAQCVYAVPLQTGTRLLGILDAGADQPDGIRSVTRKLIDQIATQAALALERSELYKQLRDSIDERKKAEEERNRLQQQLFQAQKMEALGTLAGGIAHDFNNLLSVMLGFASLARQRLSADDPLQDSMGMIEQSAQRAAELTRQLLGFARPERQQVKPVCVDDVLDRVRRMVERTFDRNITVAVHKGSEPLWVNAEPSYLEQALLNYVHQRPRRDATRGNTDSGSQRVSIVDTLATGRFRDLRPGHYVQYLCPGLQGQESRRKPCPGSSSRSSPPKSRAAARGWVSPWFTDSSKTMTGS